MGKLIRDKIPEIIKKDGQTPIIRILDNKEFLEELDKKLLEEVNEYKEDKTIEELADVLEVFLAICKEKNFSLEEVEKVRKEKRDKRGGFDKHIFWEGNK